MGTGGCRPAAGRGAARGGGGRAGAAVVVVGPARLARHADDRLHDRHPGRARRECRDPGPPARRARPGGRGERPRRRARAQQRHVRVRRRPPRVALRGRRSTRRLSELRALSDGRRLALRRRPHAGVLDEAPHRARPRGPARASATPGRSDDVLRRRRARARPRGARADLRHTPDGRVGHGVARGRRTMRGRRHTRRLSV